MFLNGEVANRAQRTIDNSVTEKKRRLPMPCASGGPSMLLRAGAVAELRTGVLSPKGAARKYGV